MSQSQQDNKQINNAYGRPGVRPSRGAMRSSLLLPTGIGVAIWLVGLLVYLVLPTGFETAVALIIGLSLLFFLLFWTRQAPMRTRITAVLLAIPALIGITLGMVEGQVTLALYGIGITFILLVAYRFLSTPASFRAAYRLFERGQTEAALDLINRSINARPDFWESYQLRALIHLSHMQFGMAIQDGQKAIQLNPDAHPVYNTLGQTYLAQTDFTAARDTYLAAVNLSPTTALYHYHLGLAEYRLGNFELAAAALAQATQGTLPTADYDLLAYYFLARSLEQSERKALAEEVWLQSRPFADALPLLQEALTEQPDYPHKPHLLTDLTRLAEKLPQLPPLDEPDEK